MVTFEHLVKIIGCGWAWKLFGAKIVRLENMGMVVKLWKLMCAEIRTAVKIGYRYGITELFIAVRF